SFFFSSRRRHTRFSRDWSSDVCSPIHCLDMVKASTSHAMHESAHNSDQDLTQADCFPDMPQHSPDCLDCGTTACQSLITSLPIAAPELSVPDRSYPEKFRLSAYHGKHLAGYWQEILRPPKA